MRISNLKALIIMLIPVFLKNFLIFLYYKFKYAESNIHYSAWVSSKAILGKKLNISSDCRIYESVVLGDYTSINYQTSIDSGRIGKFCSIGAYVHIGLGQHSLTHITTSHNLQRDIVKDFYFNPYINPPIIGNDVWIGSHVCIMQNVKIGHGAIIGASSVVTKDIPDYAIVVGNPAKIIRFRFKKETIEKLLELKWWNHIEDENIKNLIMKKDEFERYCKC